MQLIDKYIKHGWTFSIANLEVDNYQPRLIVRVATGRKYWPLFSEVINIDLGKKDKAIINIENSLPKYTHFMVDRFISELEMMLSDLYNEEIKLQKPKKY